MSLATLDDLETRALPVHIGKDGGALAVLEESDVGFTIRRIFFVQAGPGVTRGRHAHRALTQALYCAVGSCDVICDDGMGRLKISLGGAEVLIIPPGIWAEQVYLAETNLLAVACDHSYEERDYVRDYDEFRHFRKQGDVK
jgi:dTDP-4-dehydrorhamnose 3,5-epimerase-like enzyme